METIPVVHREVARGSTRRFLLLLCLLVVACVYMFYVMALSLSGGSLEACASAVEVPAPPTSPAQVLGSETFGPCRAALANRAGAIAAAGTGGVLVTAFAVYWWLPAWRRRRGRLVSADQILVPRRDGGSEPLSRHLHALAAAAGFTRTPEFLVDRRAVSASAVAFGRAGRYTICLHAGLVARRATEPESFDAVVWHELAHVQSRDIDVAYLVVALWRVVSLAVLVPFVVLQSWLLAHDLITGADRVDWVEATPSLGKLAFAAFLVAQVYLARSELLRSRELCADLDAVGCGADPRVWDPVRRGEVVTRSGGERSAPPGWLATLWRSHPSWHQRHSVLTGATSIKAGASGLQALLAGAALFGVLGTIQGLPGWLLATLVYVVAPILVTALIAATPRKNPEWLRVSHQGREHHRRIRRVLWPAVAYLLLLGVLVAADPLGGYREGTWAGTAPTVPSLPAEYPFTAMTPERWLDSGGRDAAVDLVASLDVDVEVLASLPGQSPELAAHCGQVGDALDAGHALPVMSDVAGQLLWQEILHGVGQGSAQLCLPRADDSGRHREVDRHYQAAARSYDRFVEIMHPYAAEPLPPRR